MLRRGKTNVHPHGLGRREQLDRLDTPLKEGR
jgi:hypothetical protein